MKRMDYLTSESRANEETDWPFRRRRGSLPRDWVEVLSPGISTELKWLCLYADGNLSYRRAGPIIRGFDHARRLRLAGVCVMSNRDREVYEEAMSTAADDRIVWLSLTALPSLRRWSGLDRVTQICVIDAYYSRLGRFPAPAMLERADFKRFPNLRAFSVRSDVAYDPSFFTVCPQLTAINLLTSVTTESTIASLGTLPLLESLSLGEIDERASLGLLHTSRLRALSLSGVLDPRIAMAFCDHFPALKNLKLTLNSCQRTPITLPDLTSLKIDVPPSAIQGKYPATLQHLTLWEDSPIELLAVSDLEELRSVDLEALAGTPSLAGVLKQKGLEYVRLPRKLEIRDVTTFVLHQAGLQGFSWLPWENVYLPSDLESFWNACSNLRQLRSFSSGKGLPASSLEWLRGLKRLQELDIWLDDEGGLAPLVACSELESLHLSQEAGVLSVSPLAEVPGLRQLSISCQQIRGGDQLALQPKLLALECETETDSVIGISPAVVTVELRGRCTVAAHNHPCRLLAAKLTGTSRGGRTLARGCELRRLTIGQRDRVMLGRWEDLQQLETLEVELDDLSWNLAELKSLGTLAHLRLVATGRAVGAWDSSVLGQLSSLRYLTLCLSNVQFSLVSLTRLPQLIGLSLEACDRLDDLSPLSRIPSLHYLSLVGAGDNIPDCGWSVLGELQKLETLSLSLSMVPSEALTNVKTVRLLDLTGCHIDDLSVLDEVIARIRDSGGLVLPP